MQPLPNRLGLGLRPPLPSYGQGPSMSALAQQQQMLHQNFVPPQAQKLTTLFVGSISGGITDAFLNRLLTACGPVKSFKRLITPANKPQGFGFAEYEEPDAALRCLNLLQSVELPALEDGCANKKLLIKADEKTRMFLDAYQAQRMKTDTDDLLMQQSKAKVDELVAEINRASQDAANSGLIDKEKYVIPPHLHDLQEADLPETQRGLVISEIAQFRERAAKREREKMRDVRENIPVVGAPSGPKVREWGKPQPQSPAQGSPQPGKSGPQGHGKGAQGYSKPVGFVKAEDSGAATGALSGERQVPGKGGKTDEELESDRKEARRRDEEVSFRDRERRYEPRERARIQTLERSIARQSAMKEAEERDRIEMRSRLDVWDDDESDELFYVDRVRWRQSRVRRLAAEEAADSESRLYEERETENLRLESEKFLARQMEDMQALAEEQRKAGMLLDDGAPVKLNMSLTTAPIKQEPSGKESKATLFGQEEEEEEDIKKRKVPLVKLDFSAAEGEKAKERVVKIKESVPHDKETLFKAKVRWDGLSDMMIDRKFEPLVKRQMVKYLGELEDDDLIMFVLEHLKDHKGPQKLVEGLEPVLEEEAGEFAISVWRQVIFESMAYGEGLHTEKLMVD
ncbi:hypothetical protein SERLA73DRAFT_91057 [Serpula lacrymans var. lacrymans S7.3]|uniref:PWI domain-containing protein n=2 Tax=Serpula lacrymans var. lacrymans TaxID=341189 RepID=F8Q0S4_SERL3|nr:uncharacterized protein SERLADRAFT_415970 [Serpula lacrymans var. lacrymans S7.9]EGN97903.1 hypothetical protein SERLA73DRAFT_91057 [Serpula lacrymans var. lacrymans S7.3]EGO23486.1 hypothetical protein SERLADRAFT_415970 [Serpula lacrymans var. lacrymans S7.9]